MVEGFNHLHSSVIDDAERVRARVVAAGSWFSGYLIALGVASAVWIVLLESVFPEGFPRSVTAGGWAIVMAIGTWWAERHAVYPVGATRTLTIATAVWFLAYLLLVGPLVRWQFDTALLPWALAALLLSTPFIAAAAWMRVRR